MSIHPPANFWQSSAGLIKLYIDGILYATDPLYVTSNTLYVKLASPVDSGVVSTVVQSFSGVKTFIAGINLSDGHLVTTIPDDGTLVGASHNAIATEYAVKTYVDTHIIPALITSVSLPLHIVGTDLQIYEASGVNSGVVSIGTQTIAGDKSFSGITRVTNATIGTTSNTGALITTGSIGTRELWCGNGITLDGLGSPTYSYIRNTLTSVPLMLYSNAGLPTASQSALIGINNVANGGSLDMYSATTGVISLGNGSLSNVMNITATATNIINAVSPQLSLVNNLPNKVDFNVNATGDFTINASGDDVNIDSSDVLHVLNTSVATSSVTGALISSGSVAARSLWSGLGLTLDSYYSPTYPYINSTSTTQPLTLYANSGSHSSASSGAIFISNIAAGGTVDLYGATGTAVNIGVYGSTNDFQQNTQGTLVRGTYQPQFCVGWDATNKFCVEADNSGNATLSVTGTQLRTATGSLVRIQDTTNATGYTDGSIHTEGGMSVAKNLYANLGVVSTGDIQGKTLYARNVLNSTVLDLSDTVPTGSCTISIVTGGHTNIVTSGSLLYNGVAIPYETSTTLAQTWSGAITNSSNIYLKRLGNIVTARFVNTTATAVATSIINATVAIPVGYRPIDELYQGVIVYCNTGGQTCGGTFYIDGSYIMHFYASCDITNGQWPSGDSAGYKPFVSSWMIT